MKPKGHKKGCGCVVCSPRTGSRRRKRRNHGYENQAATLHERARRKNSTVMVPGTLRSRNAELELRQHRARRARAANPVDEHAVRELELYADTSSEPVYRMSQAVIKNLVAKRARGSYDTTKAEKAWLNVANFAAQEYTREFGGTGHGSYGSFSMGTRRAVARRMLDDFEDKLAYGEFRHLEPKPKRRRKNPLRMWNQPVDTVGTVVAGNPAHYPRTGRGPKGHVKWYILDLFDGRGRLISSRYRKCARAKCATEATGLVDRKVGKRMVRKVELSGPYSRKPNAHTTRK